MECAATLFLGLAVIHTFLAPSLHKRGRRFARGSFPRSALSLLGEVEAVFPLWALGVIALLGIWQGGNAAAQFLGDLDFTEPGFVFVVMAISATRPILGLARYGITSIASALPFSKGSSFVFVCLVLGPLMGSFLTEPAAMTVTALLLKEEVFDRPLSPFLKYALLGTLFVNVSVGGVLTPFAAPPVLMVAKVWGWDFPFVFSHFGWKAVLAVVANAGWVVALGRKEWRHVKPASARMETPLWLVGLHLLFLIAVVRAAHFPIFFGIFFLGFLLLAKATAALQSPLRLKESLMVAAFLGGLVVLGSWQGWWLNRL
jgi:hypothetical protein